MSQAITFYKEGLLLQLVLIFLRISSMQGKEIEECEENTQKLFKQFDIVNDVGDHHFAKLKYSETFGGSKVTRQIMIEWRILENDLPESIYVRAYKGRIDLLRACITGAAGTPYHDGLYFFDLRFPADYPANPPEVHYNSYGLSINSNVCANGKICLSLLNTQGRGKMGSEDWKPKESTVLQVLLSIQALVLNENPYFNHLRLRPGWDYFQNRSLSYNEQVFVESCKTMIYVLNRPPMHFRELVSWHFRQRAHAILTACNAYMNGCVRVGGQIENESSSSSDVIVWDKFKVSMDGIYPKLLESFMKNGSSLEYFVDQLNLEKEKAPYHHQQVGFIAGAVNTVKNMFGFKELIFLGVFLFDLCFMTLVAFFGYKPR